MDLSVDYGICPIPIPGEAIYSSAEQCFQAVKADHHNKLSLAHRITRTEDPYKCKKLGDEVKVNNEWVGVREGIMSDIVYNSLHKMRF